MADKNVKIFNAKGEYTMSEEDNFKTAKSIALESAKENLYDEVENFLREKFPTLDYIDIVDIGVKFLKKNEPRFIRENLPNGDMICYTEIQAEISLTDLGNFMKNFDVFKLEKKVDEQKKTIDELKDKFELFQEFFPALIRKEIDVKNNPKAEWAYNNRGSAYYDLENYQQAIKDYTKAIKLNPNYAKAYNNRGLAYLELKYYSRAIEDFTQAIKLDPNDADAYNNRGLCYKALGRNAEAEADLAKAREIRITTENVSKITITPEEYD